jgi:hypothetical protein
MLDSELFIMNPEWEILPRSNMKRYLFMPQNVVIRSERGLRMTWTQNPARCMVDSRIWITVRTCGECCRGVEFYYRNARDKMIELLCYSEIMFARGGQVRGRRLAGSHRFAPEVWEACSAITKGA